MAQTWLDNGIAALKTAREQLKVYRQAILKHAFEGKLTAQWREENKDKLTDLANVLLEKEVIFKDNLEEIFGKRPFEKTEVIFDKFKTKPEI